MSSVPLQIKKEKEVEARSPTASNGAAAPPRPKAKVVVKRKRPAPAAPGRNSESQPEFTALEQPGREASVRKKFKRKEEEVDEIDGDDGAGAPGEKAQQDEGEVGGGEAGREAADGEDVDVEKTDGNDFIDEDDGGDVDLGAMRQHEYEQVARFGPTQLQRYEQYRRSDLKKEKIKKVLTAINPILSKSSDPFLIAVKGLAKVFVGDVVETALEFRQQCGDTGPLQTKHLREAYRQLRQAGAVPTTGTRPGGIG
jgi:transcription initiation factor TFIID subunit 11